MLRVILTAILFSVEPSGKLIAQQIAPKATSQPCNFSEIYKKDGWLIPGLREAKVKFRAAFANVSGVFVTEFSPVEPKTTIEEISCSRDHEGRLEITDRPIRILKLLAWEYEGHIFAYSVEYELQVMQAGERVALGAMTGTIFYDVDGSGLFTIRKGAGPHFLPEMPPGTHKAASQPNR